MIPVLIWFLARVIREVKAIQEGFAMQCAAADLELLGHAVKRSDLSSPGDETWQLRVARYVFGTLLLGSNTAYATRLQATRWGAGVHIEEFRHVLKQFLAEWTGESNVRSIIGSQLNYACYVRKTRTCWYDSAQHPKTFTDRVSCPGNLLHGVGDCHC